jgi:glucose-6-phosphate isomerase, archaeal
MKLGSIYNKPISVQLDPRDGSFEPCPENEQRMVSHLSMMFSDQQAVETILKSGDRLVYEIRYYPFLTGKSDMVLGTTMILPGKVGNEYHMTKGHFHEVDNQPEIYHCVQGEGILQMMTLEGDYISAHWIKDTITHIPPQYAHRVINTGSTPLIYVASFHVAAGHNYGPIIDKGFKYIVVEQNGVPFELLNPRWK